MQLSLRCFLSDRLIDWLFDWIDWLFWLISLVHSATRCQTTCVDVITMLRFVSPSIDWLMNHRLGEKLSDCFWQVGVKPFAYHFRTRKNVRALGTLPFRLRAENALPDRMSSDGQCWQAVTSSHDRRDRPSLTVNIQISFWLPYVKLNIGAYI